jgi:hypothetical protein
LLLLLLLLLLSESQVLQLLGAAAPWLLAWSLQG